MVSDFTVTWCMTIVFFITDQTTCPHNDMFSFLLHFTARSFIPDFSSSCLIKVWMFKLILRCSKQSLQFTHRPVIKEPR
jgi:hypothetical protein